MCGQGVPFRARIAYGIVETMKSAFGMLAAVFVAVAAFAAPASAATLRAGETYSLPKGDIVADNLYAAGGDVTLLGILQKDAFLAGGNVIVGSPVGEDLAVAAGTVNVIESVGGDVRIAGGQVSVAGGVGGDLVIAGGVVHILEGASIAGDLVVAGGYVRIDGRVAGATRVYGGEVTVNAILDGDVLIRADEGVVFGSGAALGGALDYAAPREARVEEGASLGENVSFSVREHGVADGGAFMAGLFALVGFFMMVKFLAGLVAVLIATLAFRRFSQDVAAQALSAFPRSAGIGFLALVAVPAAAFLLLLSLIGIVPALFLGFAYALLLLAAHVLSAVVAGAVLALWFKKEPRVGWQWALLGFVSLNVITIVPVLGWAVCFIFFLAALGVVSEMLYRAVRDANI
jgi:hypothetical protein